jgi:hypothetical protein
VPLDTYGPRYHVPVVTFNFGSYWDSHYRNRPFYHDRDRWSRYDRDHHNDHRPPPRRAMPNHLPRGFVQQHNDGRGGPGRDNDHHDNDHHDNDWQQQHR